MSSKHIRIALAAALLLVVGTAPSRAITINFDDQGLLGPSTFAAAGPAQTIPLNTSAGLVTFSGGVVLTETVALPANQTSLYGTAYFGDASLTNPLTLTFENSISNFFLDVYNGWVEDVTYRVSDNQGHSSDFTLAPNLSGGTTLIGFPAVGNIITVEALNPASTWDFFIDNIHFNEPLPTDPVPEPTTFALLGLGVAGVFVARRRNRRAV